MPGGRADSSPASAVAVAAANELSTNASTCNAGARNHAFALPVRLLSLAGLTGIGLSLALGVVILVSRAIGNITVPGYAATVLTVMFFGGLNSLGIGILGEYLWRTFENTKGRPGYVVLSRTEFSGRPERDHA